MYSYCLCDLFYIVCSHRANWHSPTALTEAFPCFLLSYKADNMVYLAKTEHGPHDSQLVNCVFLCIVFSIVLCYILFVCKYVHYHCHQVALVEI